MTEQTDEQIDNEVERIIKKALREVLDERDAEARAQRDAFVRQLQADNQKQDELWRELAKRFIEPSDAAPTPSLADQHLDLLRAYRGAA